MSFLWGKRSSDTDSGSRARHVADLVACFPSIRRPNNDDSSFEFSFEIDRNLNTLRVWLPSDFPSTKPMLQIVGPVQHPWLDQFKRVSGSEKLTYWDKKTSSLREVVEDTLSELRKSSGGPQHPQAGQQQQPLQQQQTLRHSYINPSQQYQQHGKGQFAQSQQQQYQPPQQYLQQQQYQQPQPPPQGQQKSSRPTSDLSPPLNSYDRENRKERSSCERFQISLPGVPTEFPELQSLQISQLERLKNDEVAMMSHAASLECVETLRTMRDDLCKSNADDARRNLQKRGDAGSEEEEILILQNNLKAANMSYKIKLAQCQSKHAMSRETVVSHLNSELALLDNSSEDLAQDFVNGGQDVNSFLHEYLKVRGEYHGLKVSLKTAQ